MKLISNKALREVAALHVDAEQPLQEPRSRAASTTKEPGNELRACEDRVHPWPDTSTPASVLSRLMEEHGLTQSDLPEVGAQSVVSAVLAGKRKMNLRQVTALAKRFSVPLEVLA